MPDAHKTTFVWLISMQSWLNISAIIALILGIPILPCMYHTSNIWYAIIGTAAKAATPIYGTAVAVPIAAPATTKATTTTAPITEPPLPFAVVAQGRAPVKGDMGARPIFGTYGNWYMSPCTKPSYSSSKIINIDELVMNNIRHVMIIHVIIGLPFI